MRKGKSVIGKQLLSLADGSTLDSVKDVILGTHNDRVVGLLVGEAGLLSASTIVPFEEVTSFGKDAIVVKTQASVMPATALSGMKAIVDRDESLLGTKVFTESGDEQGKISDVYFDELSGTILGMEVSGGAVSDVTNGLRYLPVEEIVRVGRDAVYVQPEAAENLASQKGGLSGALADTGAKAKGAMGGVADKASGVADKAKGAAGDTSQDAQSQAAEAKPEERLIGKRSGRDVEDDRGSVIVPAGRRISADDVERARAANKVPALTAAAGVGEAGVAAEGVKDALGGVGDGAVGLWDKFTRKIGEVTDASGQRVDEEQTKRRLAQIEDAVGRPVTKVILDLEDTVVLDLGDIITHAAIQRAHEAGGLDSLLDSVYKGEVTFERDEMRAERPGQANLENASVPGISAPLVEELRTKVDTAEEERQRQSGEKKQQAEADRKQRETEHETRRQEREQASTERQADAEAGKAEAEAAKAARSGNGAGEAPKTTVEPVPAEPVRGPMADVRPGG
ncbi:MAG: PRC-barrel domain-containing protein [Chloroflexi bacterium]|nr:PRC-barrel domain-containing protein [Chloroflexota bacterium]